MLRVPGRTPLSVELKVGEYLVVARKDDAFHEVIRRVPHDPDEADGQWSHEKSKRAADGSVLLPKIKLFSTLPRAETFVDIPGGTFIMGQDAANGTRPHERTVRSFRMMQDEVTVELYQALHRPLPHPLQGKEDELQDDHPIGYVSWPLATSCAEQMGCRLPTEAEFEFAATSGGMTEFPWGPTADMLTEWQYGPVRVAEYDVRPGPKPIYGLYSNAVEWTANARYPYPETSFGDRGTERDREYRMVRSGSFEIAKGEPIQKHLTHYARMNRASIHYGELHPHLGFRCVRSEKPRFFD